MTWTGVWNCISENKIKALSIGKALPLLASKWTQMAHEKSSTILKKYLKPLYVGQWKGTHMSAWSNSNIWEDLMKPFWKERLCCLACGQIWHTEGTLWKGGKKCFILPSETWPNLSCHKSNKAADLFSVRTHWVTRSIKSRTFSQSSRVCEV